MKQASIAVPVPALPGESQAGSAAPAGEREAVWPFLEALGRRRWLAGGIFALTLASVAGLTAISPKSYTTHVELIAGASGGAGDTANAQTSLPVLNALLAASNMQSSETYVQMLRETPVMMRTISDLHLGLTPAKLLDRVAVKSITNTSIVDLAVSWPDPAGSARVANGIASSIVAFRRDLVTRQADTTIAELKRQLEPAGSDLRRAADDLAQYQARIGVADATAQTQNTLAASAALDQKAAQAPIEAQQAAASLKVVEAQLARTPASISGGGSSQPNPVAAQLRTQLAQINVQLETALRQYTEDYPAVKSLRAQKTQLERELAKQPAMIVASESTVANPMAQQLAQAASQLRVQLAAAQSQVQTVRRQRAAFEARIRQLPLQTQRLAELQRRARMSEFVYDALNRKLSDATVARTTTLSDVAVIQAAAAGDATVAPNLPLNLVLGAIVGLIIAVTGAIVVDFLDGSIKTESDVEERLALPLLATLPMLGTSSKPAAPWVQRVMIESVLHLVTSLRYASSTELKTVAFTSASPGEGKSTVALAAAIAYAAMTPRALIVDADLRCPTLHVKMGLDNERGLSDALVGTASFHEVVRPTQHPGLDAVTSGTRTTNPAGLLQSEAFERFLATARQAYAMVIVDATACGPVADATLVCSRVDGAVFVVARDETDVRLALKSMRRLHASGVRNLLGAVLNKIVPSKREIGPYGIVAEDGSRALPFPPARSA
jgi:capsular exopolysaccharide synthesis family protein